MSWNAELPERTSKFTTSFSPNMKRVPVSVGFSYLKQGTNPSLRKTVSDPCLERKKNRFQSFSKLALLRGKRVPLRRLTPVRILELFISIWRTVRETCQALTDYFSPHFLGFLTCEWGSQAARNDIHENLRFYVQQKSKINIDWWLTGFGARAATVNSKSSLLFTPSMKHTSAPISDANLRRCTASSMPSTWAASVLAMMT